MALTYGSRGDDVLQYQQKMKAAGIDTGPLDGIWGDKTEAANKAYAASMTQATNTLAKPAAAVDPLAGLVGLRSTAERMGGTVGWDPKTGPSVNGAKIDTTGMKNVGGAWYGTQDNILGQLGTTKAPAYQTGGGMFSQEQMQGLIDKILNPQAFSFDPATNPAYQAMQRTAEANGEKAFNNNLADLTSATGGRLNSWAAGQASQARSNEMSALDAQIPGLYEMAYGMWNDQQNRDASNLGLLQGMDNTLYGRSRDAYGDFRDNVGTALDLKQQGVQNANDTRNYNRDVMESDRNFTRSNMESDRNYALNVRQENRIGSGSGATDKSIAGMGTPDQVAEYYDTLKSFGAGGKSPAELYTAASTTIRGDLVKLMGEKLTNQLLSDVKAMDTVVGQPKTSDTTGYNISKDPVALRAIDMMGETVETPSSVNKFQTVEAPKYTQQKIAEYVMNNVTDDEQLAAILNYLGIPDNVFDGPQQYDGSALNYKK